MEKRAQVQEKYYRIGDFENVKNKKEFGVFPNTSRAKPGSRAEEQMKKA